MKMINNNAIWNNLRSHFPNDADVEWIAYVMDKLVGKQISDIDLRTKNLVNTINFHFDDPNGRIVKIEKRLNGMDEKLDKIVEHLDIKEDGTSKLSRMEDSMTKMQGDINQLQGGMVKMQGQLEKISEKLDML